MKTGNDLVLPIGTKVLCIKDCYEDNGDWDDTDGTDDSVLLYWKDKEYIIEKQGFIRDEEGILRQWKADWFTLTRDFHKYFTISNLTPLTNLK